MRLHTDKLTESDIREALQKAKNAGRVDSRVSFVLLYSTGSRSRAGGYEVQLGWYGDKVKGDGRRFKNSGSNGSSTVYAAFYEEWGWFILELFRADPGMVFGSYKSLPDFEEQTRYAFCLED